MARPTASHPDEPDQENAPPLGALILNTSFEAVLIALRVADSDMYSAVVGAPIVEETLKGAAILVITGLSDEETRRDAAEVGAAAVLDKPFELDQLRAAVAAAMR